MCHGISEQLFLRLQELREITIRSSWLPIMKAYEENRAAYFATPPVNLIYAYRASLELILRSNTIPFDERLKRHIRVTERIRECAEKLGLRFVAQKLEERANGMTAVSIMLQPISIAALMNGWTVVLSRGSNCK